jgi:phosphatidylglycerophosphate synthase
VTLAVLCAGRAPDAAIADDLTTALRAAGATSVERIPPAEAARRASETGEKLLICVDDLVAHPSLLWMLATEPAGRTTALVVPDPDGDLREERGRVVPGPGAIRYVGAVCVAPDDLPVLVADESGKDPLDALMAGGVVPIATRVRLLHAERVHTQEDLTRAKAAIAAVDEEKARLRLAVKEKDDFFTTYAVSTWSPIVTRSCARLGLTPSGVTGLSVLLAVGAALLFWQASRPAMIAGAVLLYQGFVLDCVDGQLARFTRRFGAFGGWLDTMADRAKEYAAYAGLAAGAERIGLPYAWPLAITAILLQTVRHMTDAWHGALHDEAAARPVATAETGVGARLSAASNRVQADTGSLAYWLKRIVVFPIGERWALIAVLAALFTGRVALAGVVVWGLLAFGYTFALRSLRSIAMRVGVLNTVDTGRHRDDGLLARNVLSLAHLQAPLIFAGTAAVAGLAAVAIHTKLELAVAALVVLTAGLPARAGHAGPLDWLVPAALRAAEYLLVAAAGLIGGVHPPIVFLLLFVLAMHHYDLVARMEKGAPGGSTELLGWDGRVVLLAAATLAGQATIGMVLISVLTGAAFLKGVLR